MSLSDGIVSEKVLDSGEIVTEFTRIAEKQTEQLTGIRIDSSITDRALLQSCNNAQNKALTADSRAETLKFRDFKAAGTQGIESCKIRSLILPLLADHVLREANHFIRILEA